PKRVPVIARQSDEIRARQTATDKQSSASGADVGIVCRTDRYGQVQIAILENHRPVSIPMLHHTRHALAQDFGNEKSAVEENGVGTDIARARKKLRQMSSD